MSSSKKIALEKVKQVKILCISETGWFDTPTLLGDIKNAGGTTVSQYTMQWQPFGHLHPDNAGGSSALVEVTAFDGHLHQFLFDTGWGPAWMDRRFAEEGVDKLLQQGAIEFLVISHEHFDHFWGIIATLKHCPNLTIYVPQGFHTEGFEFIKKSGHTGELIVVQPDKPLQPFPGLLIANFKVETLLQVRGENILYFNVQDKGIGLLTGCGHTGIINLLNYAHQTFEDGKTIYAIYGGLHISPFEEWDAERDKLIQILNNYGIRQLGCNHCTGIKAVEKMIASGLPVVRGTARNGSKTDLFLGNGDVLIL